MISLDQQIEEVDREIELRKRVYPGMVRSGRMRESISEFHMTRIMAVRRTLRWLKANQEKIKATIGDVK